MGKSLIIKGADFSTNSIGSTVTTWYTDIMGKVGSLGSSNLMYGVTTETQSFFSGYGHKPDSSIFDTPILGKRVNLLRIFFKNDTSEFDGSNPTSGPKLRTDISYTIYKLVGTALGAVAELKEVHSFKLTLEDIAAGEKTIKIPDSVILNSNFETLSIGLADGLWNPSQKLPVGRIDVEEHCVLYYSTSTDSLKSFAVIAAMDYGYVG